MNGWTSERVNKLIVNELIVKEDRVTREVDKGTSEQVNELIVKEDKVTRERVDKLDELTREQVDCEERQSNRRTGVNTYNIWEEKGLKKARD